MRRLAIALAAAAVVASPGAALAQGHSHGMGAPMGGFAHPAGGLAGHGFHGGFHHGFRGCCFGPGPFAFGFFLGLAASPWWYYGDPYWWGYDGPYGYDYPPPPPGAPPPGATAGPQVCGSWVWKDARYNWVPAPCPAPEAPPPPPAAAQPGA